MKKLPLNTYFHITSIRKIFSTFLTFNLITNFIIIWQVSYNTLLHYGNNIPTDVPGYIRQAKTLAAMTSPHHSYRIGIPFLANIINKILSNLPFLNSLSLSNLKEDFTYHLSYYVLNLIMSSMVFIIIFLILDKLRCNRYLAIFIIYSFQLTTTYLGMISLANIDLVVVLFVSSFIYLSMLDINKKILVCSIFSLSFISIFFKEYIFLASLPSVVVLIKENFQDIKVKISILFLYLISISSSIIIFRKIFDFFTYPVSKYKYIDYVKGDIFYMLKNLFTPFVNLNTFQNFFQYSPILILFVFVFSLKNKDFRILIFKNYLLTIFPLFIFISLTGVATYPIRVFFPYYIYLLIFLPETPLLKRYFKLNKQLSNKI